MIGVIHQSDTDDMRIGKDKKAQGAKKKYMDLTECLSFFFFLRK
jgi:hypothetical protein